MQLSWTDITQDHKDISGTASSLREACTSASRAHQQLRLPVASGTGMRTGLAVLTVVWRNRNHSAVEGRRITACLFPSMTSHPSHNGAGGFLCRTDYSVAPGGPLFNFVLAKNDQFCGWVKKLNLLFNQTCLDFYFPFSSVGPGDTRRSPGRRGL